MLLTIVGGAGASSSSLAMRATWATDLETLSQPVGEFLERSNAGDYFSSWAWYRTLFETCLGPDDKPALLTLSDSNGEVVLGLPARLRSNSAYALGREVAALTTPYSTVFRPIRGPDIGPDAAVALAHALRHPPWPISNFSVECLDPEEAWFALLEAALKHGSLATHRFAHFGNWYADCAGMSADTFFARLPGEVRNTVARKERQLHRTGQTEFVIHSDVGSVHHAIEQYETVYRKSWKEAEPYPDFIASLIRSAARVGALRLGVCMLNGNPIAAQIWIVSHGAATIFKLAYDEAYKRLSVGTVLTAHMLRLILQSGEITSVDFGRGDDPYKRDWLNQRRQRYGLVAFNPRSLGGLAGWTRHELLARAKKLLARSAA